MISTAEINKMPIKDRIILMGEIWSTLRDSDNSEIDSPEWHGKTLRDRREKIENGTATFITIDQLKRKG